MAIIPVLDGLQQGTIAAIAGAISRPVQVLNREVDGVYEGKFPRIDVVPMDAHYVLINSGQLGQDSNHLSLYGLVIYDRIQKKTGTSDLVATSQTDVYTLIDAIVAYFALKSNMALPNNSAKGAGVMIRFRFDPFGMYKRTEAGVGPVAVGVIGVIGPLLGDGA